MCRGCERERVVVVVVEDDSVVDDRCFDFCMSMMGLVHIVRFGIISLTFPHTAARHHHHQRAASALVVVVVVFV